MILTAQWNKRTEQQHSGFHVQWSVLALNYIPEVRVSIDEKMKALGLALSLLPYPHAYSWNGDLHAGLKPVNFAWLRFFESGLLAYAISLQEAPLSHTRKESWQCLWANWNFFLHYIYWMHHTTAAPSLVRHSEPTFGIDQNSCCCYPYVLLRKA